MFDRLFPPRFDRHYEGHRAAPWLLGLLLALKLLIACSSLLNPVVAARDADGIPLDTYGAAAAHEVLTLFMLVALGQLVLVAPGAVALLRYRAMVPFAFLLLLVEHAGRRALVLAHATPSAAGPSAGAYVGTTVLALICIGFVLSVWPPRTTARTGSTTPGGAA